MVAVVLKRAGRGIRIGDPAEVTGGVVFEGCRTSGRVGELGDAVTRIGESCCEANGVYDSRELAGLVNVPSGVAVTIGDGTAPR